MELIKTILFIAFPYKSHVFPLITLAHKWQKKGYRVVITGNSYEVKQIITREGFVYFDAQYLTEYSISSFKVLLGLFIKSVFDKKLVNKRYREFYKMQIQANFLQKKYNPEIIFLDEHLSFYYFFFKNTTSRLKCFNTKLSTLKKTGVPPLNSFMVPKNTMFGKLKAEVLWFMHISKLKFSDFKRWLAFFGRDDNYFLKRISKKNNISFTSCISHKHSFYVGIKGIETILLSPKELDANFTANSNMESYFNMPVKRNETNLINSIEYQNLVQEIIKKKENPNLKIVCCSFGTIPEKNRVSVINFLIKTILEINDENIFIVIATKLIPHQMESNRSRIFSFLPMLDFLKYVDVMITHGGMGTIKECLQKKIPMVNYPFTNISANDQPANAVRVEQNGFGIMGKIQGETVSNLTKKIFLLLKMNSSSQMNKAEQFVNN